MPINCDILFDINQYCIACVCVCVCMFVCVRYIKIHTYYVHAYKILCNATYTIPHTCFVALAVTVSVESGGGFFEQLGQNSESA